MDRVLDRVGDGIDYVCWEDLNGWVRHWVRVGITITFGVPEENDNRRRVVDFCPERGLYMGHTYFEHKSLHNYTRVAWGQD